VSRIGKLPIQVPKDVDIEIKDNFIKISSGKLALEQTIQPGISIDFDKESNVLKVNRADESKSIRSLHGLYRSLIKNMVTGVTAGFTKELEIVGIGYRAELKESRVHFQLGYSHPIVYIPPEGIEITVPKPTVVVIKGHSKQLVGQIAAKIRSFRPPEPYKGKGIRYANEQVRHKVGKSASK
jgi:large subunit ribosomal protein L6